MRRNSAVAWLESQPRKPNPAGSAMPQRPDASGSDPAASIVVPSRRAKIVIITGALSLMRNPATDPAATSQVPSTGPTGGRAAAEGSVSGAADGWDLTKIAAPATTRTTRR